MGYSTKVVVMYGVDRSWDDKFSSHTEELDTSDLGMLDYLCGTYMKLGAIIAESNGDRWEPLELDAVINTEGLPLLKEAYIVKFEEQFPDFMYLLDSPWKLMVFTHTD